MQCLKIDQDIKTLSEVRTSIANCIKQASDTKRPLVITQHGKDVAVLLDVQEYKALQKKIEIMTDIQTSINQIENWLGVAHEKARELMLDRVIKGVSTI